MVASLTEYLIESLFFNKSTGIVMYIACVGLLVSIAGQILRTVAMYTAGKSFTHLVAKSKRNEHVLVTQGVYSLSRHPSYAGWFYWAVFTQVLLVNPICVVAYAIVAFRFFKIRIEYEEDHLIVFFGDDYKAYKKNVSTLIPFL